MLKASPAVTPANTAPSTEPSYGLPASLRRKMWVAMAVAAAALVAVVLPEYFRQRQVARHVANPGPSAVAPAMSEAEESRPEELEALRDQPSDVDAAARTPSAPAGATTSPEALSWSSERSRMSRFKTGPDEAAESKTAAATLAPAGPIADNVSFIYDVPNVETQQAVVQKFEQSLAEQQIVLEDPFSMAIDARESRQPDTDGVAPRPSATSPPAPGGLATVNTTSGAPGHERVYVVEATPLQLSNAISSLENMAAAAPYSARELGRAVQQPLNQQQRTANAQDPAAMRPEAQSGAQQQPAKNLDAAQQSGDRSSLAQNRSQAVRLYSYFENAEASAGAAPTQSQRVGGVAGGAAPAPPSVPQSAPPAEEPDVAKKAQDPSRAQLVPADKAPPADRLQRAVIIFRVVPVAPAAQAP